MAHPYHGHREHHKSRGRVGHIMKSGGHAHSDVAADKKLFNELIAKHEAKEHDEGVPGHKHGGRLDKYARGGRTKHKAHTQVNIAVVAPHGGHHPGGDAGALPGGPAVPPPRPPVGGVPPGLPPGGPPMAGPPGLPPGGPPGGPPGLGMKPPGMMKRGGKVKHRADGGRTQMEEQAGQPPRNPYADVEGKRHGGKVKGYARGGKLGMTAGADSGEGRLQKAHKYGAGKRKG